MKIHIFTRLIIGTFLLCSITNSFATDHSEAHPPKEHQNMHSDNTHADKTEHHAETPEHAGHHAESQHQEDEKFNTGEFLFGHIGDSYEWHITNIGGKHISVYLPVLLISKDNGFVMFSSRKFHHGHSIVEKNGYEYEWHLEGEFENKIIETAPDGTTSLPFDFSITKNVFALFVSILILILLFVPMGRKYKQNPVSPPTGVRSWLEPVIIFIRDEIAKPSIGHKYERFTPYLLSIFFFIWFNNILGLIPIFPFGANVTGNISVTMVLALFTYLITTFSGNKTYWSHIFNTPGVPWWLKYPVPLMPFIEFFGTLTKPFVLMVRLFANITAGHIIVLGFMSLIFIFGEISDGIGYGVAPVSIAFGIFMNFLELLVAFIQAYVFTFLSALYFGMAVEEHH